MSKEECITAILQSNIPDAEKASIIKMISDHNEGDKIGLARKFWSLFRLGTFLYDLLDD